MEKEKERNKKKKTTDEGRCDRCKKYGRRDYYHEEMLCRDCLCAEDPEAPTLVDNLSKSATSGKWLQPANSNRRRRG